VYADVRQITELLDGNWNLRRASYLNAHDMTYGAPARKTALTNKILNTPMMKAVRSSQTMVTT
jgi:hypothetical protein